VVKEKRSNEFVLFVVKTKEWYMKKVIMSVVVLSSLCCFGAQTFNAKNGLLVMEAESTSSSLGKWKKMKSIDGYTGECHLEFTGNKPTNGPATSPLKYYFTVDKDGVYKLMIRAHKRLDGARHDLCNDCYVVLDGAFKSGGKAPLEMLKENTKLYGGSDKGWGWTAQLDKNHKKFPPLYELKKGEKYKLTISGRSQRFNMDRIIFRHSSVKDAEAKDPKAKESAIKKF
jgi:hypothetical protein